MARKKDSNYFHVDEGPCYCVFENPYFIFDLFHLRRKSVGNFDNNADSLT